MVGEITGYTQDINMTFNKIAIKCFFTLNEKCSFQRDKVLYKVCQRNTWFPCGYRPAMAAVHLFFYSPSDKTNQSNGEWAILIFPTGFDTALLIGQYFSSGWFWAIASAMLLNKVMATAKEQPFG